MTGKLKKILEYVGQGITIFVTALDTYVEYRKFQSKKRKKSKKRRKEGKIDG